jgi:hypothetical protein
MVDLHGYTFTLGCKVARAVLYGKSPMIDICKVTKITDSKLYLDSSKVPIKFPERLLIIDHDPLVKMINDHAKELEDESSEH